MKKQNSSKSKPYYVPVSIQKLVVFTVLTLYLVHTAFLASSTFAQIQQGSDYRPQLGYLAVYNLVPIVVFLIAYALNPRKLARLSRLLETLLITLAGLIGWSLLDMLLPLPFMIGDYAMNYRLYEYASSIAFIIIYTGTLLVIRKKGLWS